MKINLSNIYINGKKIDTEVLTDAEKLIKIKQIYKQWAEAGDNADVWAFKEIGKVLEQE
jgi:hypothetical protein